MSGFLDQIVKLVTEQLDLLLIVAIVFLIQCAKRALPKFPKKAWMLVMVLCGFLAAWLTVPTVVGHGKEIIRKGLIYSAGSELLYQFWRTFMDTLRSRIGVAPRKKG